MQVVVENTGSLERKIRVDLPEERVRDQIKDRLHSLMRTTRVSGFRPGKVPMKIIESRYGGKVRREVVSEMIRTSLYEALKQENLKPTNAPRIDQIEDKEGNDLSYTASFEVYPEVNLTPMDALEIEKPTIDISQQDVDKMVEVLRRRHARFNSVARVAAVGDVLNINFEGKIDGRGFDGGSAEQYELELGAGVLIEGFERGLTGKSANQDVKLRLRLPDNYYNQDLKGKEAEFNIHINEVKEVVLPELNDELFEKYGVKQGGIDAFRTEIRDNMDRQAGTMIRRKLKDAVLHALLNANQIELPQSLIHSEEHRLRQEMKQNLSRNESAPSEPDTAEDKQFAAQASRQVSLQLILSAVISKNKLKTDPAKVRAIIERVAAGYENPDAVINWYYSNQKKLAEVEALALEDEVVDWVVKQANIRDRSYTFDELMNNGQTIPLGVPLNT